MKTPVFIFGSGRCGSTLLQRALNLDPEITIFGEHAGFLNPLSRSFAVLVEVELVHRYIYGDKAVSPEVVLGKLKHKNVDISWVNCFKEIDVYREYRGLLENLLARAVDVERVHWGFKEIRYTEGSRVIWFLRKLYPDSVIVVLSRRAVSTVTSMMLAWHDRSPMEGTTGALRTMVTKRFQDWIYTYEYLLAETEKVGGKTVFIRYEDLVENPDNEVGKIRSVLGTVSEIDFRPLFSKRVSGTVSHQERDSLARFVRDVSAELEDKVSAIQKRLGYLS